MSRIRRTQLTRCPDAVGSANPSLAGTLAAHRRWRRAGADGLSDRPRHRDELKGSCDEASPENAEWARDPYPWSDDELYGW